tara:strand:+ start:694 stop:948 length:255 start_codon:yes stop_codon:yes gene_type:complete
MNTDVIEAYKAKMVAGVIYKNMKIEFIELNDNGILLKVILNKINKEKNSIGVFKYDNIKYCFLLPLDKSELLVNIPSKYIKTKP